jgi:predicted enzyme related to lactoylglutathione lyase
MASHEIKIHDNIQGIGWFARRIEEPAPTVAFYRDVMGLPFLRGRNADDGTQTSGMLWSGDTRVMWVSKGTEVPGEFTNRDQAPLIPVYRVTSVKSVRARLEAGGARFINDFGITEGRIAYFIDPSGWVTGIQERWETSPRPEDHAAVAQFEAGEQRVEGIPPMAPDVMGLGWVVMRANDPEKASAFYRDVLGFYPAGHRGPMSGIGENILLEILPAPAPIVRTVPTDRSQVGNHMILRVHDLDAMVDRLNAAGVHWVNPPLRQSGRLAYFLDADGQLVGIQQRMADSDPRPEDFEANRRWAALHA